MNFPLASLWSRTLQAKIVLIMMTKFYVNLEPIQLTVRVANGFWGLNVKLNFYVNY